MLHQILAGLDAVQHVADAAVAAAQTRPLLAFEEIAQAWWVSVFSQARKLRDGS